MKKVKLFASCPVFLEDLVEKEVLALGGTPVSHARGGIFFETSLENCYRFMLWTRVASRVLLLLDEFTVSDSDDLYKAIRAFDWSKIMNIHSTFICHCTSGAQKGFNTSFAALKMKDGIADYWQSERGERPSVDKNDPDLTFSVHVNREKGTLYLDLSGASLHRRGYRLDGAKAALRENTAAAFLYRAGWDKAEANTILLDPMCGSGTLLIEGATMAAKMPSNLFHKGFGFYAWMGHDPDLWETVFDEAEEKWKEGLKKIPPIYGFDQHKTAVQSALENVERAGLKGLIHIEKRELSNLVVTEKMSQSKGFLITNPPYGVRLGEKESLSSLYRELGDQGKNPLLSGWNMSVISDDTSLLGAIGLKASRKNKMMNGPLACSVYHYELFGSIAKSSKDKSPETKEVSQELVLDSEGEQFQNRILKNRKILKKWLKKEEISSYRLYDADLPNFNFAIDIYEDKWIHIQEYAANKNVDEKKAEKRRRQVVKILCSLFNLDKKSIYMKSRRRQKGKKQYEKVDKRGEKFLIKEWGMRLWCNFADYLDTGIFLDHRNVRRYLKDNSQDKRVLNLFAYTCTASLMAAAGGAKKVISVDTSSTYLTWGEENFRLNGLDQREFRFDRSDSEQWLLKSKETFDLIFMDPPTFSNSKSREGVFDVQKDHEKLISLACEKLNSGGVLIFSNNFKGFEMGESLNQSFKIKEISSWTQSRDFSRKGASHRCWQIENLTKD